MKCVICQYGETEPGTTTVALTRDDTTIVWFTHIVTLAGYLHRSHREKLALPLEAYSPPAWCSTMYVNRRGHDVSNSYRTLLNVISSLCY
jgi:hypothetical protein